VEYSHWPAWAGCLALLHLSSGTPPHQLNMTNWKKVLDFLATTENISVLSTLCLYQIQTTAATGRKINSFPAKIRTGVHLQMKIARE